MHGALPSIPPSRGFAWALELLDEHHVAIYHLYLDHVQRASSVRTKYCSACLRRAGLKRWYKIIRLMERGKELVGALDGNGIALKTEPLRRKVESTWNNLLEGNQVDEIGSFRCSIRCECARGETQDEILKQERRECSDHHVLVYTAWKELERGYKCFHAVMQVIALGIDTSDLCNMSRSRLCGGFSTGDSKPDDPNRLVSGRDTTIEVITTLWFERLSTLEAAGTSK